MLGRGLKRAIQWMGFAVLVLYVGVVGLVIASDPRPLSPGMFAWDAVRVPVDLGVAILAALQGGLEDRMAALGALLAGTPATCKAPPASAEAVGGVEAGNAAFATALFARLGQANPGNLVSSPFGVSATLAMAYAGASQATASQLAQALGFTVGQAQVPPALAQVECQVEGDGRADGNQLSVANGLFGQRGSSFQEPFLTTLETDYGAPLQKVDFSADAARSINGWVSSQTHGRVEQLFAPGSLDASSRLVLANAIYFKGRWAVPFEVSATRPRPFSESHAKMEQVPFMHQTDKHLYYKGPTFAMLELPYKGGKLAMDFVLPDDVEGLPALEGGFDAVDFHAWVGSLQSVEVEAALPKFSIRSRFDLTAPLRQLGMPDAFDVRLADFSGMDGARDLFIGAVVQQALVEVDEEGTVAVAATGTDVLSGAVAVPKRARFIADHPFLFVLRDLATGSILFLGRVANPH